jgi:predicted transcriptional regulator
MAAKLSDGYLFNYKMMSFLKTIFDYENEFPERDLILKQISRKAKIELSTVIRYVDEFEEIDFLRTAKTGRVRTVELTTEGRKFYQDLAKLQNKVQK